MRAERLRYALESGALDLSESRRIAVIRPRMGDDLSALQKSRVQVITGFKPDFDWFVAEGWDVVRAASGAFDTALVCLPRARDHARALLAMAVDMVGPDGLVVVDGQKTEGIEAALRDLRLAGASPGAAVSKAHGKVFAFRASDGLAGWAATDTQVEGGFLTRAGIFSADGPDKGSALLAAALPARLPRSVADLGAGWGYLARAILARDGVEACHLIEAEADALDCARANLPDPRAHFHWADALAFRPQTPFDAVVCNPPFHTTRQPDPGLGVAFIRAAARMLTTSGTLWLVANRHLPYEHVLAECFRDIDETGGDSVFRLYRAARPVLRRQN